MKKLIVIFFSAALGVSFLFIGFGSYFGQSHVLKIGKTKITSNEFSKNFDDYKNDNDLTSLSEQETLISKIQFLNKYVNELVFEEYLKKKIIISENSKKIILRKSLNNDEMFRNLDEATLQNYLKEITNGINSDIFNNTLDAQELVKLDINPKILKEKELNIFEIVENQNTINRDYEDEYFDKYDLYEVYIDRYDIKKYIKENIINQELLKNFYDDNISKYTKNNNYTYEQIISEKELELNFEELKKQENVQFKLFENVDEDLILPKVKLQLEKIDINSVSPAIQIGNKYFYIKKKSFDEKIVIDFNDVKEEIINEIILSEINEFDFIENKKKIINYLQENIYYSNSFNFLENIPSEYNFINFNTFDGQSINDDYLYDFTVNDVNKDDLSSSTLENFLISYTNYKENIETEHKIEELKDMGSIKVNYFTDSLTIKGFFLSEEDLENVVSINETELLKVALPNEVIYLQVKSFGTIDPKNIKQNIINLIYSQIIEQVKNDLEITINNEQLLKL